MEETTLKHSRNRSIVRIGARVEKRWHHPGAFSGLLDRWRAGREARRLELLLERGVRVPRVIERRGTTLSLEWIESAGELERVISAPPSGLAERLGRWISELARAGVQHGDLHPGNVLIDPQGEPVLIDMAAVSIGGPLRPGQATAQLEQFLAGLVEPAPPGFCARLITACDPAADVDELLGAARVLRRASVRRELDRWLRESSRCRLEQELLRSTQPYPEPFVRLRYEREAAQEMQDLWLSAARLFEHGIACARPLRWQRGKAGYLELCLPQDAQAMPVRECLDLWEPALAERGLRVPEHTGLRAARDSSGQAYLVGVRRIEDREGAAPWR